MNSGLLNKFDRPIILPYLHFLMIYKAKINEGTKYIPLNEVSLKTESAMKIKWLTSDLDSKSSSTEMRHTPLRERMRDLRLRKNYIISVSL